MSNLIRPRVKGFEYFEYGIDRICLEIMRRRKAFHLQDSPCIKHPSSCTCGAQPEVSDEHTAAFLCSALRKRADGGLMRVCVDRLLGYDFFEAETAAVGQRHVTRQPLVDKYAMIMKMRLHSVGVLVIGAHHDFNCSMRRTRVHFYEKCGKLTRISQVQRAVLQHLQLPHGWRAIGHPVCIERMEYDLHKGTEAEMPARSSTGGASLRRRNSVSKTRCGTQNLLEYENSTIPDSRRAEPWEASDVKLDFRRPLTCPRHFLQRMAHVDGSQAVISMYLRCSTDPVPRVPSAVSPKCRDTCTAGQCT